jgi:hypothetical protein
MGCTVYGGAVGVVCSVCSGYDGRRVTGVQCTIWRVMVYAVYGGCSVGCVQCTVCVQSMGCTVYGGAVDVVCSVCSGYGGRRVTGVQCTIWRVVYAVYLWWGQCMVCAVCGGCSVW